MGNQTLPLSTKPLVAGAVPTADAIRRRREFRAVARNGHVLTEREWSDVIGDNILVNGQKPPQRSPWALSELTIEEVVADAHSGIKLPT